MPSSKAPFDDAETEEYSISLSRPFIEELAEQYPRARSVTDALYMAAEEAVEHRRQEITPEDITGAIVSATDRGDMAFVADADANAEQN